jgi:hypothetical protein
MTDEEFEAVKEVLLRHLHETEDEELQAALWQLLLQYDEQEARLTRLRNAVRLMIGEARK